MKREELKRYTSSEIEEIDDALLEASEDGIIKMTRVYIASEADSVMDAMEARIKELESQLENVQASMYAENVDANMALIKANERIKELEAALQTERDFGLHIARCADRDIEKLTSENARLKAMLATTDESSATEKENG